MATLLIVDDDRAARRTLELAFSGQGHETVTAADARGGMQAWREHEPDVVLLDLMLPDGSGQQMLEQSREQNLGGTVIMITGHQDLDKAIAAMRAGAFDYVHKPLNIDELELTVAKALESGSHKRKLALVADLAAERSHDKIVGASRALVEVHKQIGLASRGRANVLITGESGTGKELVARAIHRYTSPEEPFVPVNCSALAPTLLESELFGHEKGAFTGAEQAKPGRFELAGGGTLFLDEIGDLAADLQVKLLRVLQERNYERVGGISARPFAARVIVATHRDLETLVRDGSFRDDLYYRLNVVHIHLLPLRERLEDLEPLVEHLLVKANRQLHREVAKVPEDLLDRLRAYDWPGNVRELENRIVVGVMTSPGDLLQMDVPEPGAAALSAGGEPGVAERAPGDWRQSLEQVEKKHIARVLEEVGGNYGEACDVLGISRPTLRRKLREYGLRDD